MATNDSRRPTSRRAAHFSGAETSSSSHASDAGASGAKMGQATPMAPSRARISNRSAVDDQLRASRSRVRTTAGEARLSGTNRPEYGRRDRTTKVSRGPIIAIAIAALVVILVGVFVVRGCVGAAVEQGVAGEEAQEPQQVEVSPDDSITYQGVTFTIGQSDGRPAVLFQEPEGGTSGTLFQLEGTPVSLILYDGAIIVPENLGGSWDLMAYTMGNDSLPTQVMGADGSPVTGQGDIVEAVLDGTVVRVTDSTGSVTEVSLV